MHPHFIEEGKNYVSVRLPLILPKENLNSRSFRRRWNQLPRLQRVVIGMLLVVLIITLLFITTSPHLSSSSPESSNLQEEGRGPLEEDLIDKQPFITQTQKKEDPDVPDINLAQSKDDERDISVGQPGQIPPPIKRTPRQEAVVAAMRHAWKGYKTYSWGHDHLMPISKSRNNWLHLGLTLIDSLDTLWMMDLKEEFAEAREWVNTQLNFNINREVNLFETTIRVLGGLLSSYHLTNDKMFLDKAVDLADRLLGAFNSDSGIPFSDVNLATRMPSKPKWGPDSSTSEVSTIQLEFRDLSRITGNPIYAEKVNFVSNHIHKLDKLDGLVPIFINAQSGLFRPHSIVTLGARADSYYEYLLKQWVQMGRKEESLKEDFVDAVSGMEFHLAKKTFPNRFLFFGELHGASKNMINKMDELTCYLPGTLALGVHFGLPPHHMEIAKDLMYTCTMTWLKQPTSLAPEITYFNVEGSGTEDFFVKNSDAHYLLRPETIESLWYLYHLTGNTTYQDWGWKIFQGIEKHCRVENGYTSIGNVKNPTMVKPRDKMESFFLGETLKYFFLLFSEDQKTYSLDKWVFNSEAHLLPIYND